MRPDRFILVPIVLFLASCGSPAPEAEAGAAASTAAAAADHDHAAASVDGHGEGHDHAQSEPMPMLAIMRQLSVDLASFTHALWLEDFARMSESSAAIAHHAPIAPADVSRMQSILGAEWAGFEEADHAVHEASEELHRAVETRDLDAIVTRLAALQRGCVACHRSYRDRVLSEGSAVPRR